MASGEAARASGGPGLPEVAFERVGQRDEGQTIPWGRAVEL
jgi:hypothetical protein